MRDEFAVEERRVPIGTKELFLLADEFLSSLSGLTPIIITKPSLERLGYFLSGNR